jgi:DNA-binding NarL/FixJ family response regulator
VFTQSNPVRVLLADDAEIIRRGVKTLLEVEPTIQIVGEAAKFTELLSMAAELKPDIVVMELHMPGGTEFAPHFISTRLFAHVQDIVVMSFPVDDQAKSLAASYSPAAFVDKCQLGDHLISTIMKCCHARPEASNAFAKGQNGESTSAFNLGCAQAHTQTACLGRF